MTKKKNRGWKIFLIVVGVLIMIRLLLPFAILKFANYQMANMKGYYGEVEDIDLALYRGAYQIQNVFLDKVDSASGERTEFLKVKNTDLSIHWKALFQGKLAGEIIIDDPEVTFTKERMEPKQVIEDSNTFQRVFEQAMPLDINKVAVNNGKITYRDFTSSPSVDVSVTKLYATAENLTNSADEKDILPSPVKLKANVYEGQFNLNMGLNLLKKEPTFDMTAELENTNLVLLNDFMKAYGTFDVNKGTFGLYTEVAAKEGSFKGYVKPFIEELDVRGPEDKNDGFFQKAWESIVGAVGQVLENPKEDQVATKVPIEGSFQNPDIQVLEAIWELLKNAFIQALMPAVDQQINISSVDEETEKDDRNLFQRLFGGGKNKDKKEKNEDDKKE